MPRYQVWLACDDGKDQVEIIEQVLSEQEEQLAAQAMGLFYAGVWEAPDEVSALRQANDWIRDAGICITPGS